MKNKTGLKGVIEFFPIDFRPIDTNTVLDICKYLLKENKNAWKKTKLMFELINPNLGGLFGGSFWHVSTHP